MALDSTSLTEAFWLMDGYESQLLIGAAGVVGRRDVFCYCEADIAAILLISLPMFSIFFLLLALGLFCSLLSSSFR